MPMLAELVEVVIGVDTDKHTHTAAVVTAGTGVVLAETTVAADPDGYAELCALGRAVFRVAGLGDGGRRRLWRRLGPVSGRAGGVSP
jgi:hypothetical protein